MIFVCQWRTCPLQHLPYFIYFNSLMNFLLCDRNHCVDNINHLKTRLDTLIPAEVGSELLHRLSSQHVNPAGDHKHPYYQVHAIKSVSSVNTVTHVSSVSSVCWRCTVSLYVHDCQCSLLTWAQRCREGGSGDREAAASSQTRQAQAVKALSASSQPSCQSHRTLQRWTRQHNIDAFPGSDMETKDQTGILWQKYVYHVGLGLFLLLLLHCTCHPFQ